MLKITLNISFVAFLLLFLGFSGKWENIVLYQIVAQFLFAGCSYLYVNTFVFSKNKEVSPSKLFRFTFIFQLVLAIFLKLLFVFCAESEYGPSAVDAIDYFDYGIEGAKMSASRYIDILSDTDWGGIDDKGYLFYLRFLFIIFPKELVAYVVILLNSIFISIAAVALYRSMVLLAPDMKRNAFAVTAVFSSFLFFVNTSAVGLKEDLFVFVIVLSIYCYIKYMKKRSLNDLIFAFLFATATIFFRTSITASLLLVFMVGLIVNYRNKKLIVFGFLLTIFTLPLTLYFLMEFILDVPLEFVLTVAENRYADTDTANSSTKQLGSLLASIIGPFPTFVDSHDTMFYSFSSMLKMFLNLPVIWATIKILYCFDYKYYVFSFLYCIGLIFTAISGTALDMRYHIPFFIAFLILLFYFLNNCTLKKIVLCGYSFGCICVTILYNIFK